MGAGKFQERAKFGGMTPQELSGTSRAPLPPHSRTATQPRSAQAKLWPSDPCPCDRHAGARSTAQLHQAGGAGPRGQQHTAARALRAPPFHTQEGTEIPQSWPIPSAE